MHFFGSLVALAVLAADIWAILNIFQSFASTGAKVAWTLVIVLFPLIGLLVWLVAGPRARTR